MPRLEGELKVGVSVYTSSFCHSILRIEPYTACYFNCLYCYARWYRGKGGIKAKKWLLKPLGKLWSRMASLGLRTIPFRISTLADPLQPLEAEEKLTLRTLEMALRFEVPVVLNTKSTLFLRGPWKNILEEMASEGLILLQISLSSIREASGEIEPRAPPGRERLEAISCLSDLVPCVLRLQPLVPGLFEEEEEELLTAISSSGVKHVIVEFLRETPEGLDSLYARLGLDLKPDLWESYSPSGGRLLRPRSDYRRAVLARLRRRLKAEGISLATCKEGLYGFHDGRDCCGFRFLRRDKVAYRLTLYEFWARDWDVERTLREIGSEEELLFGSRLAGYPNPVRKILRAHENKLLKVLGEPQVLAFLCPPGRDGILKPYTGSSPDLGGRGP